MVNSVLPPLVRLAGEVQHYHPDDNEPERHHLYGGERFLEEPQPDYCHERRAHPRPNGVGHAHIQPVDREGQGDNAQGVEEEY